MPSACECRTAWAVLQPADCPGCSTLARLGPLLFLAAVGFSSFDRNLMRRDLLSRVKRPVLLSPPLFKGGLGSMKPLLILLSALFLIASIPSAQALSCRTDSLGTTRCDNGQTFRTDSLGTTRDNQGNSWRTDSLGTTRCY